MAKICVTVGDTLPEGSKAANFSVSAEPEIVIGPVKCWAVAPGESPTIGAVRSVVNQMSEPSSLLVKVTCWGTG